MGVSSTTNRVTYNGNGSTTAFSFPYYVFNQTDLIVYLYDTTTGAITTQALGTNYTISGTANAQGLYPSGVTVNMTVAPASTAILVITRNPSEVQNYVLGQNQPVSSTALVQQMDYLTLLVQRLEDQVSRCLQIPDGMGATFATSLPNNTALTPNNFIQINASGNGLTLAGGVSPYTLVTIPYTSFQAAATTTQYLFLTLPQGASLNGLFIKHTQAFAGTSISSVISSVGVATDYHKFINSFDVAQAVGDQVFSSVMLQYLGSWASSTGVYVQLVSTGANLSALTQGSLNVYYSYVLV